MQTAQTETETEKNTLSKDPNSFFTLSPHLIFPFQYLFPFLLVSTTFLSLPSLASLSYSAAAAARLFSPLFLALAEAKVFHVSITVSTATATWTPHGVRMRHATNRWTFSGPKVQKSKGAKRFSLATLATVCRRSVALHGCPWQARSEACVGCAVHKGPRLPRYEISCRYGNPITGIRFIYFVICFMNYIQYFILIQNNYEEALRLFVQGPPRMGATALIRGLLLFSFSLSVCIFIK